MRAKKRIWKVESAEEFDDWLSELDADDQEHIAALLNVLEREGPALGRPFVDTIRGSKHSNMKELRPGLLRILFVFDPNRNAVLLLGGDKTNRWNAWYDENIPRADALYDRHLERLSQRASPSRESGGKKGKGKRR
jgi:hypothetical protein